MNITFNKRSPVFGENSLIFENATIIGEVIVGNDVSIWPQVVLRADRNVIKIGDRSNIQDGAVIHVGSERSVIIEEEVTIGHRVTLHGCHIKRGSLIGINSTILDGVVVGENSIVAAGSVVTPGTIIPPKSMVMGLPAKVKRELTEEELEKLKEAHKIYLYLATAYLKEKRS